MHIITSIAAQYRNDIAHKTMLGSVNQLWKKFAEPLLNYMVDVDRELNIIIK